MAEISPPPPGFEIIPPPPAGFELETAPPSKPRYPSYWEAVRQRYGEGYEQFSKADQKKVGGQDVIAPDPFSAMAGIGSMALSPLTAATDVGIRDPIRRALEGTALEGTPADIIGGGAGMIGQIAATKGITDIAAKVTGALERRAGQALSKLPNVALFRRTRAAKTAEGLPELTKPLTPSGRLYDEVTTLNPMVDLKPIKPTLDKLLGEEAMATEGLTVPLTTRVAKGLNKEFFTPTDAVVRPTGILDEFGNMMTKELKAASEGVGRAPFARVQFLMKRLNAKVDSLKAKGGEPLGDILQIKKAFIQGLEQAADEGVGEAFGKLKQANMAFRNEYAMEKTAEIISSVTKRLEGRADQVEEAFNITAGRALDKLELALKQDRWLEGSFVPGALDRIKEGLKKIKDLPLHGAPTNVDAGSKQVLSKIVRGDVAGTLIGGAAGYLMGNTTQGAMIGGVIGRWGNPAVAGMLSNALAAPKGVALVEKMMQASPQGPTTAQIAALTMFLRATTLVNSAPTKDDYKNYLKLPEESIEDKISAAMEGAKIGAAEDILKSLKARPSMVGSRIGADVSRDVMRQLKDSPKSSREKVEAAMGRN